MKKETQTTLYKRDNRSSDWPPTKADGFMTWFNKKLNLIPAEDRHTAEISIGSSEDYDDMTLADIKISYNRTETGEKEPS